MSMFLHVLYALLRHAIIPAGAIMMLKDSFLGYQAAFLVITILWTIITALFVVWHAIKIIPNLALIRTHHIATIVAEMIVEISAMLGFWIVYLLLFVNNVY